MSQGTIIGIAVGVVGGLLFIVAAGLVYWYLRRARRNTQPAETDKKLLATTTASSTTGGARTHSTGPGSDAGALDSISPVSQSPHTPGSSSQAWSPPPLLGTVYEMDGERHDRVEMGTDKAKFEMDAEGHGRAELDTAAAKGGGGGGPSSTMEPKPGMASSPVLPDSPAILGAVHAAAFPQSPLSVQSSSPPQSPPPEYEYAYTHTPR